MMKCQLEIQYDTNDCPEGIRCCDTSHITCHENDLGQCIGNDYNCGDGCTSCNNVACERDVVKMEIVIPATTNHVLNVKTFQVAKTVTKDPSTVEDVCECLDTYAQDTVCTCSAECNTCKRNDRRYCRDRVNDYLM